MRRATCPARMIVQFGWIALSTLASPARAAELGVFFDAQGTTSTYTVAPGENTVEAFVLLTGAAALPANVAAIDFEITGLPPEVIAVAAPTQLAMTTFGDAFGGGTSLLFQCASTLGDPVLVLNVFFFFVQPFQPFTLQVGVGTSTPDPQEPDCPYVLVCDTEPNCTSSRNDWKFSRQCVTGLQATISPTPVDRGDFGHPFSLSAVPNPMRGESSMVYSLPAAGTARIEIYDVAGRRVRELVHEQVPAGVRLRKWDGRDDRGAPVGKGIYFVRLRALGRSTEERVVVLRGSHAH